MIGRETLDIDFFVTALLEFWSFGLKISPVEVEDRVLSGNCTVRKAAAEANSELLIGFVLDLLELDISGVAGEK